MADFEVIETDQFKTQLEEAVFWLYSHNLEQSPEFADKKSFELHQEVDTLKKHLQKSPLIGKSDSSSSLRRFPVYEGRFIMTWILIENSKTVALMEFVDSKYPKELRKVHFDD